MQPSTDLQEKINMHFKGLCVRFFDLSSKWDLHRFSEEKMLISPVVCFALVRRTFDGWWEMPGGVDRVRRAVKGVTESLMALGVPAPHTIDPEVAVFVWGVEGECEPHH